MARIIDPTEEQEQGYREWVAARPPAVRAVAERFDPWSLYLLKTSNHRVTIMSFGEGIDGSVTLTVRVSGDYNAVMFERDVFGINPDDLTPCELPAPDEHTGALLTQEEAYENIDAIRAMAGITPKQ